MERSVLGINIQYIKDYKVIVHTIGMIETTKRHTAASLKEEIMKCLNEYGIGIHQIYSNTTDNGANVVKASKLLHDMQQESLANKDAINDVEADHIESQIASVFSVVRCAAHTIQLAAYDVIKTIEKDLEECRTIVKKLRTLVRAGNTDISLPFIDNRTRYAMMESLYRIKEYIENLDKNMYINWSFVKDFFTAFQPILSAP
ncbi:uncharacterized protein LOC118739793 [Rhagoletis pomonella]|uniref:uncharacterized protein LOC118739793 n=1 Tax=Rhagoletis pomonella TaxID=28610 RepID=UPI001784CE25|nr:uncharacterized protein LOC118739793 [Rhagoletis pomonella]